MLLPLVRILLERGQGDEARVFVSSHPATSTDRQTQAAYLLVTAWLHAAEGQPREALAAAEASLEQWRALDQFHYVTEALAQAADSAFELGDLEHVEALIVTAENFPLIRRRPYLDAQTARLRAKLAGRRGEPADEGFADATRRLRELEMPYWTAVTLVDHAEYETLVGHGDAAETLLAEAREIFERLRAEPWLKRAGLGPGGSVAHTRLQAQTARSAPRTG
jgi:tetratricopeptide (TPR) repeat protein